MKGVLPYAIALSLVALASPAHAQGCGEGNMQLCGFVWNDTDGDGIQDEGVETGLNDVTVTLFVWMPPEPTNPAGHWEQVSDTITAGGYYSFGELDNQLPEGTYKVVVRGPDGSEPSCVASDPICPSNMLGDNTLDSDGSNDAGGAAAEVCIGQATGCVRSQEFDFGFHGTNRVSPGTGTPGYWKNHPEAWEALGGGVTIGGVWYTWADARDFMGKVSKNKTISLFAALVAAQLNVKLGNESSCIDARIVEADAWMLDHPVSGLAVAAASGAWQQIAAAHTDLDDYNNGRLCAPHRN
jgi:hypothetical protein